jgi:hypothetical protein
VIQVDGATTTTKATSTESLQDTSKPDTSTPTRRVSKPRLETPYPEDDIALDPLSYIAYVGSQRAPAGRPPPYGRKRAVYSSPPGLAHQYTHRPRGFHSTPGP